MNNKRCIGTAFYHTQGRSPNLRTLSERRRLVTYYKCIVVFFASARRYYRNDKLTLFTNEGLTRKYMDYLDALEVDVEILPASNIRYSSDPDIVNSFPGCLFTLDVIDYLSRSSMFDGGWTICLLDSDCLFVRSISFFDDVNLPEKYLAGIKLDYPANHMVNGQSRKSLSIIQDSLFPAATEGKLIDYYGGEFFAYSATMSGCLADEIARYVRHVKENADDYGNTFTEEHVLSSLMNANKQNLIAAERIVKRVWTADNYNNIDGTELEYSVLHLPAEKGRFFMKMFSFLEKDINCLANLSEEQYRKVLSVPMTSCINPSVIRRMGYGVKRIVKKSIGLRV